VSEKLTTSTQTQNFEVLYALVLRRDSDWLGAGRFRVRTPVVTRFSAPVQTGPEDPPVSCSMVTGFFQGVNGRGVALTTHPNLAPRLKKEYGCTSSTPLGLCGM
jgi:hypothetical protein